MERYNIIKFGMIFVFMILVVNLALAFGVSSPYWKGNPLTISPGETKTIGLRLQNMVGDDDVIVKSQLIKGGEIASVEEKEYLVKAGTKDTEVPVQIIIAPGVSIGKTYQITVGFKTIAPEGIGGVAFGTGMDTTFDVLVVSNETEKTSNKGNILILIIGTLLVLGLVVFYMKRKKINKF